MITGKTATGFEYSIPDDWYDDMELLDDLVNADNGDKLAMLSACGRILGLENKKRLYDHCRDESGRVRSQAISKELIEIVNAAKSGKKS